MITGYYHDTIYESKGYGVFRIEVTSTNDPFYCKAGQHIHIIGNYLHLSEEIEYVFIGEWIDTEKYGTQYKVKQYHIVFPNNVNDILRLLCNKQVAGLSPIMAEQFVKKFGSQALNILKYSPNRIMEVPGMTKSIADNIWDTYRSFTMEERVISFLKPFQISEDLSRKLLHIYGSETEEILRENPYILCKKHGIPYNKAKSIATFFDIPDDNRVSISGKINDILRSQERTGNLATPLAVFNHEIRELIKSGISNEIIDSEIKTAIKKGKIIQSNGLVYRGEMYDLETYVAEQFVKCVRRPNRQRIRSENICDQLTALERQDNIVLDSVQKKAILSVFDNMVTVIIGGPGTGKTFLQKYIIRIFSNFCPNSAPTLLAPTGLAAKRMAESTGLPTATIHHALGISLNDAAAKKKINSELLIVDEASMIDIEVFAKLLDSISPHTRLVIIGDAHQLPSVGPGAVLRDIIKANICNIVHLLCVQRQSKESNIYQNAARIYTGNTNLSYGDDFVFLPANSFEEAAKKKLEIIKELHPTHDNFQYITLSPFNQIGADSVLVMNKQIQEIINPLPPGASEICYGKYSFRIGDIVMERKNVGNVANGDIGTIIDLGYRKEKPYITVNFFDTLTITYLDHNIKRLALAYSLTVHKSQGAEYPYVILSLLTAHRKMLNRNLLYTAITRAKKKVIIIGEKEAIRKAIRTDITYQRITQLSKKIIDCYNETASTTLLI